MSAIDLINKKDCIQTGNNTGIGKCTFRPGLIKQVVFVPKGFYMTPATPYAGQLTAACLNTNVGARAYPIGDFINITFQGSAAGQQNFNYGASITTNNGVPKWLFQIADGNHCMYLAMLGFSGASDFYDAYFIDSNNYVLGNDGYAIISTVNTHIFKPFSFADIFVPNWEPANSGSIPKYEIAFTFGDDAQYRNNFAYLQLEQNRKDAIHGLQNVALTATISATAATFPITALLSCSNENLGDYYGATFAVVGAWVATNGTTGATITITSVSYSTTTKKYTLLLDATDTDYPAVGLPINIDLINPSALYTLTGLYLDGLPVTVLATV